MSDLILTHDGIANHYYRLFFEEWKYKRVVVRVSGGTDSALTLYLFAKFASDLNYDLELNAFTGVDTVWNDQYGDAIGSSKNVVKFVKDKFPSVKISHKLFPFTRKEFASEKMIKWGKHPNADKGKNYYIVPLLNQYIEETNSEIAVSGSTMNISLDVTDRYCDDFEDYPGTDKTRKRMRYYGQGDFTRETAEVFLSSGDKKIEEVPWYAVDKTFIAAMYRKFDLMDGLYPLTESCTHIPYLDTCRGTKFEKPPCRTCYWCNERYYAFGSYDYALQ